MRHRGTRFIPDTEPAMILALLIGCLTPEMFAARRTEQICEYIEECAPAAIPEYCSMSRKELEAVSEGSCPGGFDPDLAAKCLATFEIECNDLDATWPDCSNMPDFCTSAYADTGE